jgi:transposase-like protein
MINAKQGIASAQIARDTGITYRTAWYACHRVRCCMIDNELRLEGVIEMDETFIGGKPRKKFSDNQAGLSTVTNKRGRGTKKVPAVAAVERKGKVYVKIIEKLTSRNLLAMLKSVVKTEDSVLITDDFRSYKKFDEEVEHITINQSKEHGKGLRTINTVHGFFSIIKAGIRGNYKSLSKKYLPFYLAEFSYKYNKRNLQKNSFEEILKNAVKDEKCFNNYKPKCDVKEIVYGSRKQAS